MGTQALVVLGRPLASRYVKLTDVEGELLQVEPFQPTSSLEHLGNF
ncbi:hypothetical protein HanXRQr2_Chr13g0611641 [Helianthus annuus]|uniref:Uncharacterized protein n=1 Tax=Helianthus annuus TaxID=4232 RepID=A0A9K3ELB7_HELAN|nr:hypothetical protein HanXRQr2_Chr13g0611641 [Helianthus annuus]